MVRKTWNNYRYTVGIIRIINFHVIQLILEISEISLRIRFIDEDDEYNHVNVSYKLTGK